MDFLARLGALPANVTTACLAEAGDPINLSALVQTVYPAHVRDLSTIITEALSLALGFVRGDYADQAVQSRRIWGFWAPVISLEGQPVSVCILIHRLRHGGMRYQLCFHDPELYPHLADCLFYSGTHRQPTGTEISGPMPDQEPEVVGTVRRFALEVRTTGHVPGFYPAAQLAVPPSA